MKYQCEICGKEVPNPRGTRTYLYCWTDECVKGYATKIAWEHVEKQGDHEIWKGWAGVQRVQGIGGYFVLPIGTGKRYKKRGFRALDLRSGLPEEQLYQKNRRRPWRNLCGVEHCVTLEHNKISDAVGRGSMTRIDARLPAEPLVKYADWWEQENPERTLPKRVREIISRGRVNGYVTVSQADEACIDGFQINPTFLWGWEFLDAA